MQEAKAREGSLDTIFAGFEQNCPEGQGGGLYLLKIIFEFISSQLKEKKCGAHHLKTACAHSLSFLYQKSKPLIKLDSRGPPHLGQKK